VGTLSSPDAHARTTDATPSAPAARCIRLRLLDGFALTCQGTSVQLPLGPQRLLAFLALHPHPLRREYVAGVLWPDSAPTRAAASLRSALWRIRTVDTALVHAVHGRLQLGTGITVDVHETVARVHRLRDRFTPCRQDDLDPATLSAELLPDWVVDYWTDIERERIRQLRLHGLESMSSRLVELGRAAEAVEVALAAVRDEPMRESAHRAVIVAHLAEGNPSEALRQYAWYARVLRDQLGLLPSDEITRLVEGLFHGSAGRRRPRRPCPPRASGASNGGL